MVGECGIGARGMEVRAVVGGVALGELADAAKRVRRAAALAGGSSKRSIDGEGSLQSVSARGASSNSARRAQPASGAASGSVELTSRRL